MEYILIGVGVLIIVIGIILASFASLIKMEGQQATFTPLEQKSQQISPIPAGMDVGINITNRTNLTEGEALGAVPTKSKITAIQSVD